MTFQRSQHCIELAFLKKVTNDSLKNKFLQMIVDKALHTSKYT